MNLPSPLRSFGLHVDPRANRGTIGLGPFEFQSDPMISIARILIEHAISLVAREGTAHFFKYVLVAIIVDVPKGDAVALLQVAESAGGGDLLKELAVLVSEHAVGDQGRQGRIASAGVEVQKTVIVQVAKVRAHRADHLEEVGLARDIGEGAVLV